jgi:hypothetical protein
MDSLALEVFGMATIQRAAMQKEPPLQAQRRPD